MDHLSNSEALERTIQALPGLRDEYAEHAALITHARTLALQLDLFPLEVKLHSEYREVLRRLTVAGQPEKVDAFAALLEELRSDELRD